MRALSWLLWTGLGGAWGRLASDLDASLKGKSPEATLSELTSFKDKPNPRLSCSEGMAYARKLIDEKFGELQLKPLGSGDFRFSVPGTKDEECPDGITNLIAAVPGSDETLKDEYILLVAHLDGPTNQGPTKSEGLLGTDDSYDDAGSVAALLSMAQYFKDHPTKRSLIIFISDGEEGINNVAVSDAWKRGFCNSPAYWGSSDGCSNYPIGFTAWVKTPTVDLNAVKLVFSMDPLGAPGIEGHDFVAVLGTESTQGLQELVEEGFEGAPTHPLYINRMYAATSYSDADSLTKNFRPLCGASEPPTCLNGIPAVWFAQTAFAKYHGGANGQFLLPAMESGQVPFLKVPKELATFTLDMRKNFNDKALLKVTQSLTNLVKTVGNKDDLSYLVYDPKVYAGIRAANEECGDPPLPTCGFSLQDAINNKKAFDYLTAALGNTYLLDTQVGTSVKLFCMAVSTQLGFIISAYKDAKNPREVIPKDFAQTMPGLIAVVAMALDFYVEEPGRQPYYQTYQ